MTPFELFISELQRWGSARRKVVTASRRQARRLADLYDEQQKSQSWNQLEVIAWDDWIQALYQQLRLSEPEQLPELAEPLQLNFLLGSILAREYPDYAGRSAAQQQGMLNGVLQAWELLHGFDVPEAQIRSEGFPASQIMAQIYRATMSRLKQEGLASRAQMGALIRSVLARREHPVSGCERVLFYGFGALSPGQECLIDALMQMTPEVTRMPQPEYLTLSRIAPRPCASPRIQLRCAANWAREKLLQGATSVCVIVPGLAQRQREVRRIFQQTFAQAAYLSASAQPACGFNISAGSPLLEESVVASSWRLISLLQGADVQRWSQVFRDELVLGINALDVGAQLARVLLAERRGRMSLKQLLHWVEQQVGMFPCVEWVGLLNRLERFAGTLGGREKPSFWSERLDALLNQVEQVSAVQLGSIAFQARQQWHICVLRLALLDRLLPKCSWNDYVRQLTQLLASATFQPQSENAVVQVLGSLEAVGLPFVHSLLTDASDLNFPAALNPNPWLSPALQRELQMPGGDYAHELEFGTHLLRSYAYFGGDFVASYAVADGDLELEASPLLGVPQATLWPCNPVDPYWCELREQIQPLIESWYDDQGIPLGSSDTGHERSGSATSGESIKVKSGLSILATQAKCPMRAYLFHRLGAAAAEQREIGLDPREVGDWVHRIMEMIWTRLNTSAALGALAAAQRSALVQQCTREIIEQPAVKHVSADGLLRAIAVEYLVPRILRWLEVELLRPPFEIAELEASMEVTFAGLSFQVRVDRIDRLTGTMVANRSTPAWRILDYKTGEVSSQHWFGARIEQPQLPVYALALGEPVVSMAYAKISSTQCRLDGLQSELLNGVGNGVEKASENTATAQPESGIKPVNWEQQCEDWEQAILRAASGFASGVAQVSPSKGACDYCEFARVCRVRSNDYVAATLRVAAAGGAQ